jgi:hypothetical protein
LVIISSLLFHQAKRKLLARQGEQRSSAKVSLSADAEEGHGAMLEVLKWVHKVHQDVYFVETSAQRVLPEKADNSAWENLASKLEALDPCPPQSSLLPESLRSLVQSIKPKLADIKNCVARHRESLDLMPHGRPGVPLLSQAESEAARIALAQDVKERAQQFNIYMEAVEKDFDAAFFAPLDVRLHRGRNDPPSLSRASSTSKQQGDTKR